ncbi:hypothetical protein GJR88_02186 [Dietzia sp. DQ12-45-1b]|nr:hypothetical protein GJR88_02186 [Dietzia sp. DQ12-45-1b]
MPGPCRRGGDQLNSRCRRLPHDGEWARSGSRPEPVLTLSLILFLAA